MKKLFMLGLVLVFAFGITFSSNAADQNKVEKLILIMKSGEVNLWDNSVGNIVLYLYENTGQHDSFETTYKKHFAIINKGPDGADFLTIVVRDYQDYYTMHDACGFIMVTMADFNNDGRVDKWHQNYVILLDKHFILSPFYPPGYLNQDWSKCTPEKAQKIFDEELNYILKNTNKAISG